MNLLNRCAYPHCKTGLPGLLIPIASFKAKNAPAYLPRGHAMMADTKLCESCALSADIHQLITDKRWIEICKQIEAKGGAEPDRASLQLIIGAPKGQPLPQGFVDAIKKLRGEGCAC